MDKESTQLTLSWENFETNVQESWRKLHQTEDFADVVLACDVGQVLSSLCRLFECLIQIFCLGDGAQGGSCFLLPLP